MTLCLTREHTLSLGQQEYLVGKSVYLAYEILCIVTFQSKKVLVSM